MKSRNIIIVILSIVILIMGIGYIFILKDLKKPSTEIKTETITSEEYYNKMVSKMYSYYKIYIKNLNLNSEYSSKIIKVSLSNLKKNGFPVEEFVSYDEKKNCDLEKSYAVRSLENNEYVIRVYYVCGEDSNYNGTITTKKAS